MVTPETCGTQGMLSLGPGTVTSLSRMCGQLAHGSQELPAIHESCRELSRTRRMCRLYEKSLNKRPEVTGKWCCSKYADCRGYERLGAFFSTVLVCLDTICHAVCGAISYQLARPGPGSSHKTHKSISRPVDTGTMTPHTHIPHPSITQERGGLTSGLIPHSLFILVCLFPSSSPPHVM